MFFTLPFSFTSKKPPSKESSEVFLTNPQNTHLRKNRILAFIYHVENFVSQILSFSSMRLLWWILIWVILSTHFPFPMIMISSLQLKSTGMSALQISMYCKDLWSSIRQKLDQKPCLLSNLHFFCGAPSHSLHAGLPSLHSSDNLLTSLTIQQIQFTVCLIP